MKNEDTTIYRQGGLPDRNSTLNFLLAAVALGLGVLWVVICLAEVLSQPASGQTFSLTFNEPTNAAAAKVMHYDGWWQPTNTADPNRYGWFGSCPVGTTNITIPDAPNPSGLALQGNPVWIVATSTSSNGVQSAYSVPFLFDTNNYPLALPPLPPVAPSAPPSGLNIQRN